MRKLMALSALAFLCLTASAAASVTDPQFSFSSDAQGVTYQCSLDGAPAASCSSPKDFGALAPGAHTVIVTESFTVPQPAPSAPTAAFTISPASPVVNQAVTFDGSGSTCAATPCQYHYTDKANGADLGDSQISTFTFHATGTKFVVLKVIDAQGRSSSIEHDIQVSSAPPATVAPSNTAAPSISGTPQAGNTLTASPGTWTGTTPITYSYAWSNGQTGQTDTLTSADVGNLITVKVTAVNSAGTSSATSAAAGPVAPASSPPPSGGCDLNATTSNFPSQFSALQGGQTLCLASGNYGTWTPGSKSSRVIVKAASGADVQMTVDFKSSGNITLDGIDKLANATIEGTSHDITISNSNVLAPGGSIVVHADQMNGSSNLLVDHDTFAGQTCAASGAQGRIAVENIGDNNSSPLGLTISNNVLSGGTADGIRPDSGAGIQILNNQFLGFNNTLDETCHTDAIQEYGSATHLNIKGNFFYNSIDMAGCSFSAWNGSDFTNFEDNVVAGTPNDGCYSALDLHGDNNSTVIHNTFEYGACEPHNDSTSPCGEIDLAWANPGPVAGSGTIIRDNILTDVSLDCGAVGCPSYSEDHNLFHSGGTGTGDKTGTPQFTGGAAPRTFAGFALAPGSPGVGAASDGTNMGVELPTGG